MKTYQVIENGEVLQGEELTSQQVLKGFNDIEEFLEKEYPEISLT